MEFLKSALVATGAVSMLAVVSILGYGYYLEAKSMWLDFVTLGDKQCLLGFIFMVALPVMAACFVLAGGI